MQTWDPTLGALKYGPMSKNYLDSVRETEKYWNVGNHTLPKSTLAIPKTSGTNLWDVDTDILKWLNSPQYHCPTCIVPNLIDGTGVRKSAYWEYSPNLVGGPLNPTKTSKPFYWPVSPELFYDIPNGNKVIAAGVYSHNRKLVVSENHIGIVNMSDNQLSFAANKVNITLAPNEIRTIEISAGQLLNITIITNNVATDKELTGGKLYHLKWSGNEWVFAAL